MVTLCRYSSKGFPLVEGDSAFHMTQTAQTTSVVQDANAYYDELLKAAGLERDHRGIKRTPYSLRHFYISEQLANGSEVLDVARNCRTSLAMIDKHYGQVRLERVVATSGLDARLSS